MVCASLRDPRSLVKGWAASAVGAGILLGALLVAGCASHRQQAQCSEIRYRLQNLRYNADQEAFIREELEQCERGVSEKKAVEAVQYRSIYEQFQDSVQAGNGNDSLRDSAVQQGEEF